MDFDKLTKKELSNEHKKLLKESMVLNSEFEFIQKTNSELYQNYKVALFKVNKIKKLLGDYISELDTILE